VTAAQVRELEAAGLEIGSHSTTHVRLAGQSAAELTAEISASRASLAGLLDHEIPGFAYPYGSMDAAARDAVRAAGFAYACAVQTSVADIGLMSLPRVYVGEQDSALRMTAKYLLYKRYIAIRGRRP
jgi:peptidoglycan/xylan/chitin deacetylase (PgdA/CDA1 family)